MNRYRYLVDDVKKTLTDADKQQAIADIALAQEQLSSFSENMVNFLYTKAILAAETASFYIKQQYRFHQNGYPAKEIDYLTLLETQLSEIEKVFIALLRIHRGFVYVVYSEYPEVLAWLCLSKNIESQHDNDELTLLGISIIDQLDPELAMPLILRSNSNHIHKLLARFIEGGASKRELYYRCLVINQSVSVSLIKHWLEDKKLPEKMLHSYLALMNVGSSIEWLQELTNVDDLLFEKLILKEDRATWFRQQYSVDTISSETANTYSKLLTLKEFSLFDIEKEQAVIHFILSGNTELVPLIIEHLMQLDEVDAQLWCEGLFLVYGEEFPFLPSKLGNTIEWQDALHDIVEWQEQIEVVKPVPLRMGKKLTFDSSIRAMKSAELSSSLREWLWRELCIMSRVHFYWHPQLSLQDQEALFDNIQSIPLVRERFNLRGKHAAVGY
ncbi:hypothetical protein [Aliivibrio fischeri]|uniref:hypothetical protein n=1 Tax=Aliivibrio fischeri TaxID=668 RepID=UPI00080D9D38|nr:hypothetical protein [Aliivibrio fischeri]OCH07651.1 hypothetical protein A6E11_15705 [Aliivibrio fischeri]OCH62502.1 hypothetical protein A6D98_05735 [Aliivibrio fischeri]